MNEYLEKIIVVAPMLESLLGIPQRVSTTLLVT